jgi:hypothetical protein
MKKACDVCGDCCEVRQYFLSRGGMNWFCRDCAEKWKASIRGAVHDNKEVV